MSFRYRLALFLVVTLVAVQALTAAFAYLYLRHNLVERGKHELAGGNGRVHPPARISLGTRHRRGEDIFARLCVARRHRAA